MSSSRSRATLENGEASISGRQDHSPWPCGRCAVQKVRCTREIPKCGGCQRAKVPSECIYPIKDRKITISESYLRRIEEENRELKRNTSSQHLPYASPPTSAEAHPGYPSVSPVDGDEPNYVGEPACTNFGRRLHQYLTGDDSQWPLHQLYYYRNPRLHRLINPTYHSFLPNQDDAKVLVRAVLNFIGPDYHLLLKKSFLERLDRTYEMDKCDDYVWLCRMFVIFALGKLYSQGSSNVRTGYSVPGTAYFLKAMELFEDLYEEPTVDYIETLLAIAFYSTALNRIIPAYTYSGLALRLSLTLGLHREIPENRVMTSREREHRIRVWWTVYNLDRICTSKVGLPIMLRDEDVDLALPSMDNLTEEEREDFHDPRHIIAQYMLSKITGEILNGIYGIPQSGQGKTFPLKVHQILTSLQSWQDTLPSILKFNRQENPMYSSRSVASLHLNYSQCVILTTRPIFFFCLREYLETSKRVNSNGARPMSDLVERLSKACVDAARTSSDIIEQLRANRDLATFGFFDSLSIFSPTLILMMSSATQYQAHRGDYNKVETSLALLESMKDDGNIPAHNYYDQLMQLRWDLDHHAIINPKVTPSDEGRSNNRQTPSTTNMSNTETEDGGIDFGNYADWYIDTSVLLNDPHIQDFINQQQPQAQFPVGANPSLRTDVFSGYSGDFDFSNMDTTWTP